MTPAGPPNAALRFVRALAPDGAGAPDGELLARYRDARDEAAFAELVTRHGGMVVAVCRRVLADPADADDAAQATFLVLVRRAHAFTGHATVGDFLHGVALRTALKLRARRARRRAVEAAAAKPEATLSTPADDVRERVDRAVRALPAKLRDAVVLCELEGVSRPDAAARLNVPPGTLASRLAAARVKLARRLGPVAPVLLAALPAESARAADVVEQVYAGAVPAAVGLLATEVTRMLLFHKLKVLLAGAAVAVGATGAGVALTRTATADDPKLPAKAADKPAEGPAKPTDPPAAKADTPTKPKPTLEERYKAAAQDYAPLLGEWELTGGSANGAAIDPESPLYPTSIGFYGLIGHIARVRFRFKQTTLGGGPSERTEDAMYVVNRRRTPHEMTVAARRDNFNETTRLIPHIYEITGERLKLAYYDDSFYPDRPHGFAAKDQPAGSPPLVVLEYKLIERPQPPQPRPVTRPANPIPTKPGAGHPGGGLGAPGGGQGGGPGRKVEPSRPAPKPPGSPDSDE